ncbi:MAG: peptide ABC transporter substrate-binding protein [Dehalococcoidia bacterium]|nr:peptide ABC transporter substrate-binding protein [Dehalococcoidia bacterium]
MHRISPRTVYLTLLTIGIAALAAGWLTLGSPQEAPGARWVEGVVGAPATQVNPLLAMPGSTDADLVALVFNGLMRIDGDGTPLPDLAEHWEVTPDGKTYTFVLRSDVSWHDGHPFSAADVAFTIGLLQDPEFSGVPALAAQWQAVDPFVIDDHTILLRIPDPTADFVSRLTVGILPKHRLGEVTAATLATTKFNRAPVGTGPFRLTSLNSDRAVLERNSSYHRGAPSIAELELRFYSSATQQLDGLAQGEIDAALRGEQSTDRERELLASREDLESVELTRHAFTLLYINNQQAPLADVDLRRAIAASLDSTTLVASAGIRGMPGEGVLVPGSWVDRPGQGGAELPTAEMAWAEAGAELNDEGRRVRDGVPLSFELLTNADPTRIRLADAIAVQLEAQGVAVSVTPLPAATLLAQRLIPRDYELALFGWEANVDPDPYLGWHTSQISEVGHNIAGFQDATADAIMEAARLTSDGGERRELYAAFEFRFAEQAASVVVLYPARLYVHPASLAGFEPGLLFQSSDRFRNIERWSAFGGPPSGVE